MKKARYNEVPNAYRRNYKEEFVETLKITITCFAMVAVITLFVIATL